jgi:imidazole glycerol phosphate synthase glutamine amidotransferase subunit
VSPAPPAAPEVVVIPTGVANVASVVAGLERVGARVEVDSRPGRVADAERVVLPGVGAFGAGASFLRERGLAGPLRARAEAGRPLLAVCLGMQLLFEASEESPGHAGLGVCPGTVTRFPPELVVPHMGWNRIEAGGNDAVPAGHAYFANSYRVERPPEGWSAAWSHYGSPFVAALRRGGVLACQFHPELSGTYGLGLLQSWLGVKDKSC